MIIMVIIMIMIYYNIMIKCVIFYDGGDSKGALYNRALNYLE